MRRSTPHFILNKTVRLCPHCSYPAFAVENKVLVDITRDDIEIKLKGMLHYWAL